jgi:putative tryptophan/tyrosine transport system substrate-binding protein
MRSHFVTMCRVGVTVLSLISPDLDGKRGELLLEAVPGLRHVAVLADPNVD